MTIKYQLLALAFLFFPLSGFTQPADTIHQNLGPDDRQPTDTEVLLTLKVVDLNNRPVAGLGLWIGQERKPTVWHGQTGRDGVTIFLLPKGQEYFISTADEPRFESFRTINAGKVRSRLMVGYTPKEYTEEIQGDTILQKVAPSQMPTRSRMLVLLTVTDFEDQPHEGEKLYLQLKKAGKVYTAETDARGQAALMLPVGDSLILHTQCEPDIARFHLPDNGMAGRLRLTYRFIGTRAILAREAERARQAAIRDSLYRLARLRDSLEMERALAGEEDFLHMLNFGASTAQVQEKVEQRAAKEREMVKANARYFEEAGEEIKAALYRKRYEWSNKVVITDITGSMTPYMDQVLLWHALALVPGEQNRYLFFNDGDSTPEPEKAIGATGGFYLTEKMEMPALLATMQEAMSKGWGGASSENDLEALLEGTRMLGEMDELILIADNYSDVRDIELLKQLKAPVRIVLAGAEHGVNEDYLEIAYATGGSIHTLEDDIEELSFLADGEVVEIGAYWYRVSSGRFVQLAD